MIPVPFFTLTLTLSPQGRGKLRKGSLTGPFGLLCEQEGYRVQGIGSRGGKRILLKNNLNTFSPYTRDPVPETLSVFVISLINASLSVAFASPGQASAMISPGLPMATILPSLIMTIRSQFRASSM